MAVDVSYTVPVGGAVYAGRFAVASVASFAAQLNSITGNVTAAPAPAPSPGPAPSAQPFRIVRTGTRYATLAQAVAGAISGDTITVSPGTYTPRAGVVGESDPGFTRIPGGINLHTLTIEWEVPGDQPVLDMSVWSEWQGTVNGGQPVGIEAGPDSRSLTVRGLILIGHQAGNSYGIDTLQGYLPGVGFNGNPPSVLNIDRCQILRWADGIKTTIYNYEITVNVTSSVIEDCTANYLTHGIYTSAIAALNVRGCTFRTSYRQMTVSITGALAAGQTITSSSKTGLVQGVAGSTVTYRMLSGDSFLVGEVLSVGGTPQGTVTAVSKVGLSPASNNAGHLIKSRARVTVVEGSLFDPKAGCATCIEAPSGGTLVVEGNVILHYGQPNSSDDNPPIKYGFEESASRITVNHGAAAPFTVGEVVTGVSSGGTAQITHVLAGNTYVFAKLNSNYLSNGENLTVGGTLRGTITARLGSPDGSSNDGRTHSIGIRQNTVRKAQPGNWSGSPSTAIEMLWVSNSMTLDNGTALPAASVPTEVFNNLVGDKACGNKTLLTYANNTSVESATISDAGLYSGLQVPGSPFQNDAPYAWGGDYAAAAARTDSYMGGVPAGPPTWRVGQTLNTWRTAIAAAISSVDPALNPAMNPSFPGSAPWRGSTGQISVVNAWGSGVWDEDAGDFWLPLGGGHGNYAGNEGYRGRLRDNAPAWVLTRAPSGAIGNTIALDDGQESTGIYSDGRPRSIHPYNSQCFVPGVGVVQVRLPSCYSNDNSSNKVLKLDAATGEWTVVFNLDLISGVNLGDPHNTACCYDPVRNRVVSVGASGSNMDLAWVRPSTAAAWTVSGRIRCQTAGGSDAALAGGRQALLYDAALDRYLHLQTFSGSVYHALVHPDTGVVTYLGPVSGSLPSGFNVGLMCGAAWNPDGGYYGLWGQSSNTAQITALTPHPTTPLTSAWSVSLLSIAPGNVLLPDNDSGANGVFGRFFYSRRLGGFGLLPQAASPTVFFATRNV